MLAPPRWTELAACRGVALEVFFPAHPADYRAARAICATCPVIEACRAATDRAEDGVPFAHVHGAYAAETPRERWGRRRG
jgi:hypothetical protein